jgi:hypothetical protein
MCSENSSHTVEINKKKIQIYPFLKTYHWDMRITSSKQEMSYIMCKLYLNFKKYQLLKVGMRILNITENISAKYCFSKRRHPLLPSGPSKYIFWLMKPSEHCLKEGGSVGGTCSRYTECMHWIIRVKFPCIINVLFSEAKTASENLSL